MARAPRLVFAGTPEFAVPCLQAAVAGGEVVAVYTQPDRPAGRGRQLQASAVKQAALAHGIEVRQPVSLKSAEARAQLAALEPDLLVVVAYGLILPQPVLDIPRHGGWNVHASLLPRWRGAAPIQRAIAAGDPRTGVCLMQMERGLDTGPVMIERAIDIDDADTGGSLHDRLAQLGAQVLAEGLAQLRAGSVPPSRAQPEGGVTYAHKLEKHEARIDWTLPAPVLDRQVRAYTPWPISEAMLAGERVRIHAAMPLDQPPGGEPGQVVAAGRDGVDVACGEGRLRLLQLQRDGGRAQPASDYLNARPELRR